MEIVLGLKDIKVLPDEMLKEYQKKAKSTKDIKYNCDFKNGLCAFYRRTRKKYALTSKEKLMCCCNSCDISGGYLEFIPESKVAYVKRLFNKKTGFWRKGKGCILPRKYRSALCLSCSCELKDEFARDFVMRLHTLESNLLIEHKLMGKM